MNDGSSEAPAYGADLVASQAASLPQTAVSSEIPDVVRDRIWRSANWFFWIAALSIVNSLISYAGGQWNFVVGLGVTQLTDALMQQVGSIGIAVAVTFDLLAAGIFTGFGLLARRLMVWPFVVGMAFYVVDGLILLLFQDWLAVAFHAYALYHIYIGMKMLRTARSLGAGV